MGELKRAWHTAPDTGKITFFNQPGTGFSDFAICDQKIIFDYLTMAKNGCILYYNVVLIR